MKEIVEAALEANRREAAGESTEEFEIPRLLCVGDETTRGWLADPIGTIATPDVVRHGAAGCAEEFDAKTERTDLCVFAGRPTAHTADLLATVEHPVVALYPDGEGENRLCEAVDIAIPLPANGSGDRLELLRRTATAVYGPTTLAVDGVDVVAYWELLRAGGRCGLFVGDGVVTAPDSVGFEHVSTERPDRVRRTFTAFRLGRETTLTEYETLRERVPGTVADAAGRHLDAYRIDETLEPTAFRFLSIVAP